MSVQTESIFTVLSRRALQEGAVNLAQGAFDHPAHPLAVEALHRAVDASLHQYTPSDGLLTLREELARFTQEWEGVEVDPLTQITVVAGATEAIHLIAAGLFTAGDEVVVIDPSYEQYVPALAAAGVTARRTQLPGLQGVVTPELLRSACGPRTRGIIVNTPWNPLSRELSAVEWEAVATVAAEHDAYVISDEAYDHCVLDGGRHHGVLTSRVPAHRQVKVGSFSKSLCATGWRVGYVIADAPTSARVRGVHQFSSFCANAVAQEAVRDILAGSFAQIRRELNERLAENSQEFAAALEGHGFTVTRPTHGFFVLADVGENGQGWVERMLVNEGVAGLPVATFCGEEAGPWDSVVRFAVCKRPESIHLASERIAARL